MKEGYFQIKIGQLNEMLKQIKNDCIKLEIRLQGFDRKIGDYDVVLSKLNDLEKFRLDLFEALFKKNEVILNTFYDSILNKMEKLVNVCTNSKTKTIDKTLSKIEYRIELVLNIAEVINQIGKNQMRLYCILGTLVNRMSKKNIFSGDEVNLIYSDAEGTLKELERKVRKLVEK